MTGQQLEFVRVEDRGRVRIVTIDRPEVMNALHPPAQVEMSRVFDDFARNEESWIAILTGAGDKAFSAGNDLKFQARHGAAAVSSGRLGARGGFGGITSRNDLYKPVIAAVNGFALGGGFEMALACDILVAAENARFGLPEPRVGLLAAAGGVHRLPRQLPYHVAMGMLLTGRQVDAQEAFRIGLVNEVVPQAELLDAALRWADQILEGAPLSIRATKECVVRGLELDLDQALDAFFPGQRAMAASEDFVEGPKAFAEKRKPNWKGR
ncbi:MAG: enoyl-CoA hydratase [Acidobacteria bacterium]|nr:MAG: enoyl-CoA hydratase [Acidobacteriota bacterium]REK04255.1 MAG: enoyl-CoA hydratase [Acidobacteriota bacterium]